MGPGGNVIFGDNELYGFIIGNTDGSGLKFKSLKNSTELENLFCFSYSGGLACKRL